MIYRVTILIVSWWKEGLPGKEPKEKIRCLWYLYHCQDDSNDLLAAIYFKPGPCKPTGSIACPGHISFGTLPSFSLLFQINTVLCLVSQFRQPAVQQGLTLGYSGQIIAFPCTVRQMPYFTQRWRVFNVGVKTSHPGSYLQKRKMLLLWKAKEMKAGNEGRQKKPHKGRKPVSWSDGVWMV